MPTPSLLIVPARFKTGRLYSQIPVPVAPSTSSVGDFNVTRATSATRVNASGLIESAKTNLVLQSENFLTTWSPTNVSLTTGTTAAFTAPDGTMSAYSLADNATNGRHRVQQANISITSGTTYNFSIFIKKDSSNRFLLLNGNSAFNARAALNLDNLAITNLNGSGAAIENYGNGWYRFSIRGTATTTKSDTIFVQMQDAATDAEYIGNGSSFYIWGAQLEEGSSASEYIPTTTVARTRFAGVTVDGTSAINIPRLDYFASGGVVGCPALLVEPSAKNEVFHSETWASGSNWGLTQVTRATGSMDAFKAPDGTFTANAMSPTSGNVAHFLQSNTPTEITYTSGTIYTQSAFFKAGTGAAGRYVQMTFRSVRFTQEGFANFDLQDGLVTASGGISPDTNRSAGIENYGNGWYRCRFTATCNSSGTDFGVRIGLITASGDARSPSFAGTVTDELYGWGAQIETGSVATSYIPTTTAAITRNADVISVSGAVSGSIGQTEGTLYVEVDLRNIALTNARIPLYIMNAANPSQNSIRIEISGAGAWFTSLRANNSTIYTLSTSTSRPAGIYKIAAAYKDADSAFYVNGIEITTSSAAFTFSAALNKIAFEGTSAGNNTFNDRIRAAALYTTRLTDEQLQALTT